MNLDKMFVWITAIVIAFASVGKLDQLQNWIWRAQVEVAYQSRTSTWGSPRFFKNMKTRLDVPGKVQSARSVVPPISVAEPRRD